MLELPDDLQKSVMQALATTSEVRWQREAQALSERYRAGSHEQPLATRREHVLGYAALILPATYAQLRGAMAATATRLPAWQPRTLLDLGSGPGTALWAATVQWSSLQALAAWEREPSFIALGRELARGSNAASIRGTRWQQVRLEAAAERDEQWDLVVLGHVLNELTPEVQRTVVALAWRLTSGLLLIVEPGTSAAFGGLRVARDQLLGLGAHTIAPCTHDKPCPLVDDWCHFPQRLKRPAFQRQARGAPSEWEDSKFAYAAMARFAPAEPMWGRVIRETMSNKAYAETTISTDDGVGHYQALKRYREAFRSVRGLEWGDALRESLAEPIHRVSLRPTTGEPAPAPHVWHDDAEGGLVV